MNFENLIYNHMDFKGEEIREIRRQGGDLVFITESGNFAILVPEIEDDAEGFESELIKFLGPSEVFRKLRQDTSLQRFLKTREVIDFEEFERLLKEEYAENERKRIRQQIENEKKLYAELKAKYEGANE